jgi:hypothetical protein
MRTVIILYSVNCDILIRLLLTSLSALAVKKTQVHFQSIT